MAANSIMWQGTITSPYCPPVSVSKQRCKLRWRRKSSCHRTMIERSSAISAGSRPGIQIIASSASKECVSVLIGNSPTAIKDNVHIGYGSLLPDKTFMERFVIRFSEVSTRGKISLETLSTLLQNGEPNEVSISSGSRDDTKLDNTFGSVYTLGRSGFNLIAVSEILKAEETATNHVLEMGYAFSPGKNMNGNITVTTRMHIEVERYPEWRDLIEIDTWFQPEGKNSVRRDWIVKDVRNGENIAFATSTWVLMNSQTRRLIKMTEELWQELEPHMMRRPPKWALSHERRNGSSTKIAKLGDEAAFKIQGVMATEKDCDMNQHVNNVRYLGWMIQTVPEEIKRSHEVTKITIEYRQEASQGECVDTVANIESTESSDVTCFTHLTIKSGNGKEVNRGRTVWKILQ